MTLRRLTPLLLCLWTLSAQAAPRFDLVPPYTNFPADPGNRSQRISMAEFNWEGDERIVAQAINYSGRFRAEDGRQGGVFTLGYVDLDDPLNQESGFSLSLSINGEIHGQGAIPYVGFVGLPLVYSNLDAQVGSERIEVKTLSTGLQGGYRLPLRLGLFAVTPFLRLGYTFGSQVTRSPLSLGGDDEGFYNSKEVLVGVDVVLAKLAISGAVAEIDDQRLVMVQVGIEF